MQPKSSRLDDGKDVEKAEISSGLESQQGGYFEFVAKYKRALYSSKHQTSVSNGVRIILY